MSDLINEKQRNTKTMFLVKKISSLHLQVQIPTESSIYNSFQPLSFIDSSP